MTGGDIFQRLMESPEMVKESYKRDNMFSSAIDSLIHVADDGDDKSTIDTIINIIFNMTQCYQTMMDTVISIGNEETLSAINKIAISYMSDVDKESIIENVKAMCNTGDCDESLIDYMNSLLYDDSEE